MITSATIFFDFNIYLDRPGAIVFTRIAVGEQIIVGQLIEKCIVMMYS